MMAADLTSGDEEKKHFNTDDQEEAEADEQTFIIEQRVSSKGSNIKQHSHSKTGSDTTPPKNSIGSDEKRSAKTQQYDTIAEKKGEDGNESDSSDKSHEPNNQSIFSKEAPEQVEAAHLQFSAFSMLYHQGSGREKTQQMVDQYLQEKQEKELQLAQ